jgi:hypothetical protein
MMGEKSNIAQSPSLPNKWPYAKSLWNPNIVDFPTVLSLAEVKASVSKYKNLHTDLTVDQIQNKTLWMRVQVLP